MTEIVASIPSRIKNAADGGHVCGSEDIDFAKGSSSDRPALTNDDIGSPFYDTDLEQPIWYRGNNNWVQSTGFPLLITRLRGNNTYHILLCEKANGHCCFLQAFSTDSTGSGVADYAFIAWGSVGYNNSYSFHITPLDGRTYQVEEYTYNDKVYLSVQVSPAAYTNSVFMITGIAKAKPIIITQ